MYFVLVDESSLHSLTVHAQSPSLTCAPPMVLQHPGAWCPPSMRVYPAGATLALVDCECSRAGNGGCMTAAAES